LSISIGRVIGGWLLIRLLIALVVAKRWDGWNLMHGDLAHLILRIKVNLRVISRGSVSFVAFGASRVPFLRGWGWLMILGIDVPNACNTGTRFRISRVLRLLLLLLLLLVIVVVGAYTKFFSSSTYGKVS
jgi:hypothetical protein